MTQHQIVALNADGTPIMVTERVIARDRGDRYHAEVLTPAWAAFRFGAIGGLGAACAFLASYEVLTTLGLIPHVLQSWQSQANLVTALVLLPAFRHGIKSLDRSMDDFAEKSHNFKETPLLLTVDVPERDRQTHIQTIRGDSTIQHVYSATKHLKSPAGENMPISGELVDAFKYRVTGENAETAINRDICLAMPEFYPNENKDTQKKLYGTFIECLRHNNYVDQRRSTLHWNANGERWLLED